MPDYLRGRRVDVLDAVSRIEAVSDDALIEAVSCLPDARNWKYDEVAALAVADAPAERRDAMRGVMRAWLTP